MNITPDWIDYQNEELKEEEKAEEEVSHLQAAKVMLE